MSRGRSALAVGAFPGIYACRVVVLSGWPPALKVATGAAWLDDVVMVFGPRGRPSYYSAIPDETREDE